MCVPEGSNVLFFCVSKNNSTTIHQFMVQLLQLLLDGVQYSVFIRMTGSYC